MDVRRDRTPCGGAFGGKIAGHPGELAIRPLLEISDGAEADAHEDQLQYGMAPAVLVQVGGRERTDGGRDKAALVGPQGLRCQVESCGNDGGRKLW